MKWTSPPRSLLFGGLLQPHKNPLISSAVRLWSRPTELKLLPFPNWTLQGLWRFRYWPMSQKAKQKTLNGWHKPNCMNSRHQLHQVHLYILVWLLKERTIQGPLVISLTEKSEWKIKSIDFYASLKIPLPLSLSHCFLHPNYFLSAKP